MTSPATIDRLRVGAPQGGSGVLAKTNNGYLFGYHADAPKAAEISLLMPHRLEQYASRESHTEDRGRHDESNWQTTAVAVQASGRSNPQASVASLGREKKNGAVARAVPVDPLPWTQPPMVGGGVSSVATASPRAMWLRRRL